MPPERNQDRLETDGVLVRPIGGQIYLVEEGMEGDLGLGHDDAETPDRSPLSGLISRH